MLRDKNLIPLSHQHQHALALCVRIERASPIPAGDIDAWQKEIAQIFQSEIHAHFAAEENLVFPAALQFDELQTLISDLISEHGELRQKFALAVAGSMGPNDVSALGQQLSAHIRREERQLFERMQQLLNNDELGILGSKLESALKDTEESCLLPSQTTRLRPTK
jgi:iron-sulfur cluster repair protein YtfE (RIC family)